MHYIDPDTPYFELTRINGELLNVLLAFFSLLLAKILLKKEGKEPVWDKTALYADTWVDRWLLNVFLLYDDLILTVPIFVFEISLLIFKIVSMHSIQDLLR